MNFQHVGDIEPDIDATSDMLADFLFGWRCFPLDDVERLRFFGQLRQIVATAMQEVAERELAAVREFLAQDAEIRVAVARREERLRLLSMIQKVSRC